MGVYEFFGGKQVSRAGEITSFIRNLCVCVESKFGEFFISLVAEILQNCKKMREMSFFLVAQTRVVQR